MAVGKVLFNKKKIRFWSNARTKKDQLANICRCGSETFGLTRSGSGIISPDLARDPRKFLIPDSDTTKKWKNYRKRTFRLQKKPPAFHGTLQTWNFSIFPLFWSRSTDPPESGSGFEARGIIILSHFRPVASSLSEEASVCFFSFSGSFGFEIHRISS